MAYSNFTFVSVDASATNLHFSINEDFYQDIVNDLTIGDRYITYEGKVYAYSGVVGSTLSPTYNVKNFPELTSEFDITISPSAEEVLHYKMTLVDCAGVAASINLIVDKSMLGYNSSGAYDKANKICYAVDISTVDPTTINGIPYWIPQDFMNNEILLGYSTCEECNSGGCLPRYYELNACDGVSDRIYFHEANNIKIGFLVGMIVLYKGKCYTVSDYGTTSPGTAITMTSKLLQELEFYVNCTACEDSKEPKIYRFVDCDGSLSNIYFQDGNGLSLEFAVDAELTIKYNNTCWTPSIVESAASPTVLTNAIYSKMDFFTDCVECKTGQQLVETWATVTRTTCNEYVFENTSEDAGEVIKYKLGNGSGGIVLSWTEISRTDVAGGSSATFKNDTDGVYKFEFTNEGVGNQNIAFIIVTYCNLHTCLRKYIDYLMCKTAIEPCCDDCAEENQAKLYNFNALILQAQTYFSLLYNEYINNYFYDINDLSTESKIAELYQLQDFIDRFVVYCENCTDTSTDDCGCS